MDIQPVNPGHVLVIPTRHVVSVRDLDGASGAEVFRVACHVAAALEASGVRCEGVTLFLADGPVAGQEVFHVHLHVIPRYRGDGFGLRFGPGYGQRPARSGLNAIAAQIRGVL
jgi:histidine triad (HIT) family protein